jgi:hypothetical protein
MATILNWQLLVAILVSVTALTGCQSGDSPPSVTSPLEKASTVQSQTSNSIYSPREDILTVDQLISDYETNHLAGEKKYEGKKLELTGVVSSVEKSILSQEIYVELTNGQNYGAPKVTCNLGSHPSSAQKNKALLLRKGQRITVKGKCSMVINWIIFTDCSIK